jgi:hypothetical protein
MAGPIVPWGSGRQRQNIPLFTSNMSQIKGGDKGGVILAKGVVLALLVVEQHKLVPCRPSTQLNGEAHSPSPKILISSKYEHLKNLDKI